MPTDYHNMGFMFHLGVFFVAGFIGRFKTWPAIVLGAIIVPVANLLTGGGLYDVAIGATTGLLAGACGALILPLFWAGRHGTASQGLHFVNIIPGRNMNMFNWIKDDTHPDNDAGRKRWTENKNN